MSTLFWRQFRALVWKNWIVLAKHPFINIVKFFILPVAYGGFLAAAQAFLNRPNNYGIGSPIPIYTLESQFPPTSTLIWADGTDGQSVPSPKDIMTHITSSFTDKQRSRVVQVATPADIAPECPQNFNLVSECFGAIAFYDIPANGTRPVNYTILADAGLLKIDVVKHKSDYEISILPLQFAIDRAIIELKTGVQVQTPLEWPYTKETNAQQATAIRLSYVRGLSDILVLAFLLCFIGIAYQLPGAVAGDRASAITAHMKAMGLLDSARIFSWHISLSLLYLPAWIIVSVSWRFRIFAESNIGLVVIVHVILGLLLASWSFFSAAPFGKSPQLAAVVTTFVAILLGVIALIMKHAKTGTAFIFTLIFPPGYYVFVMRAISGFENHQLPAALLKADPDHGLVLLPILLAGIIDIFLWPWLAVLLERRLYDVPHPSARSWLFWRKRRTEAPAPIPEGVAISLRNLNKTFKTSGLLTKKEVVTAVADLTLDIPKSGIFVLLGSNGAGKSTSLSVIGGLTGITSGHVLFEGNVARPPRGTIGIVPQKNVLFPELSCLQTMQVWKAVKWSDKSREDEDVLQLLKDCDLEKKLNAPASTLSGGQKRKLQLAIGLVGGSEVVLVDECTSGVDPLSRRALWRTLTSYRQEKTIVFTTHFLDEADLLADHIAILAAPGKLVAEGSPVALKRDLGEGYTVQVTFDNPANGEKASPSRSDDLLSEIRALLPQTYSTFSSPSQTSYHLKTRDIAAIKAVFELLDKNKQVYHISSYDVIGTSIEGIFLDLMGRHQSDLERDEMSRDTLNAPASVKPAQMVLTSGRPTSPLQQALTIFHKRLWVARRSWLTPLLLVAVAVAGATVPLVFLKGRKAQSCTRKFANSTTLPLYLPQSPIVPFTFGFSSRALNSPPGIIHTLGNSTEFFRTTDVADRAAFVENIQQQFLNLSVGGVSIDTDSGPSLFAWEASPPGLMGPSMLNMVTNIIYNRALNSTGRSADTPSIIKAGYSSFPGLAAGSFFSLKWAFIFGATMAVYPAFFALYVSKERRSSVQAMQMSNGLSNPIGLWLGHLLFDTMFSILVATIIVIVLATAVPIFHGLGLLWFVLVLYGITAALFAYCVSLMVSSPLAAFAAVAGYQVIVFVLYLSAYLFVLTYAKPSEAQNLMTVLHFTLSVVAPVASVTRAALVSVNLFSLLCDKSMVLTTASLGSMKRFGGPILYLILSGFIFLGILVWVDSGSLLPSRAGKRKTKQVVDVVNPKGPVRDDVLAEARATSAGNDLLRVLGVSKTYSGNKVVDDVSFGVPRDTLFAMLGPNGAGKTTTFNVIRGDVLPDSGDVLIDGTSIIRKTQAARLSLGVCPQFTAIDSQLTVREHLLIYGRLKGLKKGQELNENVEAILSGTSLGMYADRLASKLSGGNQRKLSLAIALMGNPPVILIDEFSTGIDAKMKRDMWETLKNVAQGKAVIITTHSMEEASALATKVGILAKKVLAIGTTESLSRRYAGYEIHIACRTREDTLRAQTLMALIPGSKMADDVATRFEVPIDSEGGLARLFDILSSQGDFAEYTVEKATLESIFLKVIRENDVLEEDQGRKRSRWCFWGSK